MNISSSTETFADVASSAVPSAGAAVAVTPTAPTAAPVLNNFIDCDTAASRSSCVAATVDETAIIILWTVIFILTLISIMIWGCVLYYKKLNYVPPEEPERDEESPFSDDPDAAAELRAKVIRTLFADEKVFMPIMPTTAKDDQQQAAAARAGRMEEDLANPPATLGGNTCSICLEPLHNNNKPQKGDDDNKNRDNSSSRVVANSCKAQHRFHRDCVMGWAMLQDNCPMCRQPMWDSKTYRVLEQKELMERFQREQREQQGEQQQEQEENTTPLQHGTETDEQEPAEAEVLAETSAAESAADRV